MAHLNRRDALKAVGTRAGALAAVYAGKDSYWEHFGKPEPAEFAQAQARRGQPPLKITDVKVIRTQVGNAQFGQPECKTAGMAGDGGTQRLPRKVGPNLAAYMLFTGDPIDAETAFRVGYVIELCEPEKTLSRALEIAETVAKRAPLAVQAMKACIHTAVGATFENGLAVERVLTIRNMGTADRAEGLAAFVEKREPRFTGIR